MDRVNEHQKLSHNFRVWTNQTSCGHFIIGRKEIRMAAHQKKMYYNNKETCVFPNDYNFIRAKWNSEIKTVSLINYTSYTK